MKFKSKCPKCKHEFETKRKGSSYSEEKRQYFINTICEQVGKGEALIEVCKQEGYPKAETFYNWLQYDAEAFNMYTRAMVLRAEIEYESLLKIADNSSKDFSYDPQTKKLVVDYENINRARLRVDTRKWWLSKLLPNKYGEKIKFDVTDERKQVGGFDISLLQPDTLKLIERDLKNANIQDAEIVEDDKNLLE